MIKTIIIFGGKTMGHVIPGLAVAKGIKNKNSFTRIIYITSQKQKGLNTLNIPEIDKIYYIQYKNSRSIKEIIHIYKIIKEIYLKYDPTLVISFGSVLGTIGLFISKQYNVLTVLHEQNKKMGLGNKIGTLLTNNIFTNYKINYCFKKKFIKTVGLPTLLDFENRTKNKDSKKLVFLSGSNGAQFINNLAYDFSKKNFSKKFDITIISGEKYFEKDKFFLKNINHCQVVPFVENLYKFLEDAEIVITRAGATTLQELKKLKTKCIIIPSPNVSDNHQYLNALEHLAHGIIIDEINCTVDELINSIKLICNKKIIIDNCNPTQLFIGELNEIINFY